MFGRREREREEAKRTGRCWGGGGGGGKEKEDEENRKWGKEREKSQVGGREFITDMTFDPSEFVY